MYRFLNSNRGDTMKDSGTFKSSYRKNSGIVGGKMPMQARKRSATEIYHIMLRGIDKRNIFLDDEDRHIFLEKVKKAKVKANFKLYA